MSAWIPSRRHIHYLVTAAAIYDLLGDMSEDEVGQMLTDEVVRSVKYTYSHHDDDNLPGYNDWQEPYFYQHPGTEHSFHPAAIYAHSQCYDYQACDPHSWEDTQSAKLIAELQERCLEAVGMTREEITSHPEYEAAPWGID